METIISILQGIPYPIMLSIGLAIRLTVGVRQFNRRGLAGLQHFSNYFVGLITLFIELVLKWTAYTLALWGLWGWLFR